uniref:Putative secreted protein n=1 Tax=Anopheles darlingi TaxID=43151 RepID=A0A2M4DGI8_ANODA
MVHRLIKWILSLPSSSTWSSPWLLRLKTLLFVCTPLEGQRATQLIIAWRQPLASEKRARCAVAISNVQ